MKKTFIMALACSIFAAGANAQTEEKYYGGEQGSFAFSINAEPVLNFAGNLLNGDTDNEFDVNKLSKSIAAKLFVSDNLALKVGFSIDNSKTTEFTYFNPGNPSTYAPFLSVDQFNGDDYEYASYYKDLKRAFDKNEAPITSETVNATKEFMASIGAQYVISPGKRLQPSVGADLIFGRSNSITTTKSLLDDNTFGKETSPTTTIGLMGNLGIEFFVTEKISIGTALYFGLISESSKTVNKYETDKDIWKYHHPKQDWMSEDDYTDYDEYMTMQNKSTKGNKTLKFATNNLVQDYLGGNISLSFYF